MSEETDEADEEEGRNSLEYDSERWAPIGIEERESRVDEDPEDEIDGEGRGVRLDRRDFLKITGLGAAAALGPEVGYKAWWKLWDTPDGTGTTDWQRIPKGQEHFVPTVCQQCQGGCGIIARVIETPPALPQHIQDASWDDGRIVKIDGNPSHPVSEGSTCPKGQASLQAHYHP
ncbi:MAG: hypothetical protein GWN86_07440, partial [Desulfobacterales bacterium]|nr:hypothetical protein [Desulfobacterales bacterium]